MRAVQVELQAPDGSWKKIGSQSEVEPPGSMHGDDGHVRRVYMFGWWENTPGVWESIGGVDQSNEAFREILTEGFDLLSDLAEPYLLKVAKRPATVITVRFSLVEEQ